MSTKIQWTEETWNPIAGCSVVSPGCTNCYAMRRMAPRLATMAATPQYHGTVQPSKAGPVWTGKIGIAPDTTFLKPLRRRKPTMWFVNSMSDLFHEAVPDAVIERVFAIMALCPQHTFQVLTKRSKRMREYMSDDRAPPRLSKTIRDVGYAAGGSGIHVEACADSVHYEGATGEWPLSNVWLGVSVEDQTRADERIPNLLATPAAIRFISAEPLLGPVDLTNLDHLGTLRAEGIHGISAIWKNNHIGRNCLDWVIVGGESGSGARPMHPAWARQIRDQCASAGVPFFFKQWGEFGPAFRYDLTPTGLPWSGEAQRAVARGTATVEQATRRLGKRAGRHLDGIEHNAMPAALS